MRFLHVADLHIGKRIHERLMLDEQSNAFQQLLGVALEQQVHAVLVAGDVFDKAVPSSAALELCEEFFAGFLRHDIPVFVIPGNHDSAQQVAFNSGISEAAGLHIARAYAGEIKACTLEDEAGPVTIHLLPFLRPTDVRMALPHRAAEVKTHDDAVRIALEEHSLAAKGRHVLVAHQFVVDGTWTPETCESETIAVGGIDSVQACHFDAFDYVALGHIHGRQQVRRPQVRYAGSPVKYSFSEAKRQKAALVVDLAADGSVSFQEFPLVPIREMREVTASYQELLDGCDTGDHQDYLHVTLTDRSVYDALNRVRALYPNLLRLDWADVAQAAYVSTMTLSEVRSKSIEELFADFYKEQTQRDLTEAEADAFRAVAAEGEVFA